MASEVASEVAPVHATVWHAIFFFDLFLIGNSHLFYNVSSYVGPVRDPIFIDEDPMSCQNHSICILSLDHRDVHDHSGRPSSTSDKPIQKQNTHTPVLPS